MYKGIAVFWYCYSKLKLSKTGYAQKRKIMKKTNKNSPRRTLLLCGYLTFLGSVLFMGSCSRQTDDLTQNQTILVNSFDEIISKAAIPMSVKDNTLVFSSEENFQKCIDFLNSVGDENFDEWENHYGFNSFRRSPSFKNVKEKTDNLFATLLNCNSEIIIGANKFTIDFNKEKVYVSYANEIIDTKSEAGTSASITTEYDFTDDIFSIIEKGGAETKGTYCGGRDIASSFPLFGWPGDYIWLRVRYYTIGIYNTVTIRMEQVFTFWDMYIYSNLVMGFHTNTGESTWANKRTSGTFDGIDEERSTPGDLEVRPYARTRRLTYLYLNSDFYASCDCAPFYNYALSLSICCHSPGCDH